MRTLRLASMMGGSKRRLSTLVTGCALLVLTGPGAMPSGASPAERTGPSVRILSPMQPGYLVGGSADAKALVILEIVDSTREGIVTDDFGQPRFIEPNDNVDLFASHVVARNTYVTGVGEQVIQMVAEIPVGKLKTGGLRVTPPVDLPAVKAPGPDMMLVFPSEVSLDAAAFNFRVSDRAGGLSKPEDGRLAIAAVHDYWVPKPTDFKKKH